MKSDPDSDAAGYRWIAILLTAGCLLLTAAAILAIVSSGSRKGLSLVPLAAGLVVAHRLRRRLARKTNEKEEDDIG